MHLHAILFDLDGVLVSTDELHFLAWKALADEEGIPFLRSDNERLRGVSRMESLNILLEKSARTYSEAEKGSLAERKNLTYQNLLQRLGPGDMLPGVMELLPELRRRGLRLGVGSSSRNAMTILRAVGLADAFDVIVDGHQVQRSKPDPEVFLLGAERLGLEPRACLVVEDAPAGVEAGLAAGMPVLALGSAALHPGASLRAPDLSRIRVDDMLMAGI